MHFHESFAEESFAENANDTFRPRLRKYIAKKCKLYAVQHVERS